MHVQIQEEIKNEPLPAQKINTRANFIPDFPTKAKGA